MNTIEGKILREGRVIYREQLITIEDLETFKSHLLNEIKKILKESRGAPEKKYLKSSEVKKMRGISSGTLQNLRVNGTLPYTKVGRLVFYDAENIAKLMEGNQIKSRHSHG